MSAAQVIILCAGGDLNDELKPVALTDRINNLSTLECLIHGLAELAVDLNNVHVAHTKSSHWDDFKETLRFDFNRIKLHEFATEKQHRSAFSLSRLIQDNCDGSRDLLILNGNALLLPTELNTLLKTKTSKILCVDPVFVNQDGIFLRYKGPSGGVEAKTSLNTEGFPGYMFAGAAFVKAEDVKTLISSRLPKDSSAYVEWLSHSLPKISLHNISKSLSTNLVGGSFASLSKQTIVRKKAGPEGIEKLKNEAFWIDDLPPTIINKFPAILDKQFKSTGGFFDMAYYPFPSLRSQLVSGQLSADEFLEIISNILDFMFNDLYPRRIGKFSQERFKESHLGRIIARIDVPSPDQYFDRMRGNETIVVNGKPFQTWKTEREWISANMDAFTAAYCPEQSHLIHGDFHLQNVLYDYEGNNFILADPRGELDGGDIFYDMGKLWHSLNGLYDFIHTDQYILDISEDGSEVNYYFTNEFGVELFHSMRPKVLEQLERHFQRMGIENGYERMLFNELMHFATLSPFHLHLNPISNRCERATVLYVRALELLDEFRMRTSF